MSSAKRMTTFGGGSAAPASGGHKPAVSASTAATAARRKGFIGRIPDGSGLRVWFTFRGLLLNGDRVLPASHRDPEDRLFDVLRLPVAVLPLLLRQFHLEL